MAWQGPAVPTHLPLGLPPTQYMVEQVCCCSTHSRLSQTHPHLLRAKWLYSAFVRLHVVLQEQSCDTNAPVQPLKCLKYDNVDVDVEHKEFWCTRRGPLECRAHAQAQFYPV